MNQKIELRQVRDFGELVNDTFLFIKQNFKPLLKATISICGFFLVAYIITSAFQQIHVLDGIKAEGRIANKYGWEAIISGLFTLAYYNSMAVTIFSYICLYRDKGNIAPTVEEVWGYFKYYFWRILGSFIVLGILNIVGFAFCIIPGIYLMPIISIILAVMIFENGTLGYAFDRGFKLIKDKWWRTFGAMFIILLILGVASLIVVLPVALLAAGSFLFNISKNSTLFVVLNTIMGGLASVFMLLPFVVTSLAYFSLVEEKEGTGLMDKINMIGQNPADTDLPEEQY